MKIWKLDFDVNEYENLLSVRDFTFEELQAFDGRRHLEGWEPLELERAKPEQERKLGDVSGFSLTCYNPKALKALLPLIADHVEVLPAIFPEAEYSIINVTTVLNAIDYEKAKYKLFPTSKRIMVFEKYVFLEEKVKGFPIFRIVDEPIRGSFVSEEFKNLIEENNLTGFKLMLVWDSEDESCGPVFPY